MQKLGPESLSIEHISLLDILCGTVYIVKNSHIPRPVSSCSSCLISSHRRLLCWPVRSIASFLPLHRSPPPLLQPRSYPLYPSYLFPSSGFTNRSHSQPGSQSAFAAMGGYPFPSFSTFGVHVHHSSSGILDITVTTWRPQPHQEGFSSERGVSGAMDLGWGEKERKGIGDIRQVVQVPFLHMMDDGRCGEGLCHGDCWVA